MHVVYTKRKTGFKPGLSYRNPRFFAGAEKAAKEVTIEGNFSEIAEAYRKLGIEVNVGDEDPANPGEVPPEEEGDEASEQGPKRSRRRK